MDPYTSTTQSPRTDSPLQNSTLNRLGKTEVPQPYVYTNRTGSARVTFPDPGQMDWLQAEELLADIQSKRDSVWLAKWLSPEDFEIIKADRWNLREAHQVLRDVFKHYSDIFGSQGEESASDA